MNVNKKGFTLVELLAVIVVLAIIGLIGFTSVGSIIGKSQNKSDLISVEKYADAIMQIYLTDKMMGADMSYYDPVWGGIPSYSEFLTRLDKEYDGGHVFCHSTIYIEDNDITLYHCFVDDRGPYHYKNGKSGVGSG